MQDLIIGLGSNLGDRRKNIESAIGLIRERVGQVVGESELIETEPWGYSSENWYLNGAIRVAIDPELFPERRVDPGAVLLVLQAIEAEFGRIRTGVYADRTIDIDILFFGDQVLDEPGLIVPHPKLHERDFILASLMELCPEMIHPVLGKSVREISNARKSR
jgi:2-amino-4-hydroxy-6-hydroxymethyldihydropteridine diphosphokinase